MSARTQVRFFYRVARVCLLRARSEPTQACKHLRDAIQMRGYARLWRDWAIAEDAYREECAGYWRDTVGE